MRTLPFLLGLLVVPLLACGGDRPQPAKLGQDDQAAIAAGPDGKLAEFTDEMKALVAEGDIGGIEARWLIDTDLAGCTLGDKADSSAEISKFLETHMQKFRDTAQKDMAEAKRGEVLAVNHWSDPAAELKNKPLKGDGCKATAFGRVNVIVKPTKGSPAVIEHRFNVLYVGDAWKPFRYLPGKPNCKGKGADSWIGCKKLAEAGGAAKPEPEKAAPEKAEPEGAAPEGAAPEGAEPTTPELK